MVDEEGRAIARVEALEEALDACQRIGRDADTDDEAAVAWACCREIQRLLQDGA